MKKYTVVFMLSVMVALAGIASATWLGDMLRAGMDPREGNVSFTTAMTVSTFEVTNATDGDEIDVSEVNALLVDTSPGSATINGFTGGSEGQVIWLSVVDSTNQITMENNNSTAQPVYLSSGSDETETGYGGWTLVCNGTAWFEAEQ